MNNYKGTNLSTGKVKKLQSILKNTQISYFLPLNNESIDLKQYFDKKCIIFTKNHRKINDTVLCRIFPTFKSNFALLLSAQ